MTDNTNSQFVHNPAVNPTREWRDDPNVELELTLLIKNKSRVQFEALNEIVNSGRHEPPIEKITEILALNKWAEAYGFVALLHENDGVLTIADGARAPLRRVLAILGGTARDT